MTYHRIIIALALLIGTTGLSAQTTTSPLMLSLDECVRIALSDNPTIRINEMEIERTDYSKKETLGQLFLVSVVL